MAPAADADLEVKSISPFGKARATVEGAPLGKEELRLTDDYMRASLYLCLGMIYLRKTLF